VVAVTVLVPRHTDSAAAMVLHRAADAAVDAAPPALASGQYLEVTVTDSSLGFVAAPGTDDYRSPDTSAYVLSSVTTTWIPSDRSGRWVREQYVAQPTQVYGATAADQAAARAAGEQDYASEPHQGDADSITTAKGGSFAHELGGDSAGEITAADLPSLPRDPQKLLDRLAKVPDAGADRSHRVMSAVTELLSTGLVPADLQAAMYNALALLPDLVVTHGQVALDGRSGTALGLKATSDDYSTEIIVDDTTGTYIGHRELQGTAVGGVPAGTVASSSSVRISVTSEAPPSR
jgi:RNA polymerase sigma-70 factor (ECF subfamily)